MSTDTQNAVNAPIRDCLIVGGGINGAGIAADASGRGLSVTLCEQDDFAQHTSSASSKMIHGGLRYLEHYEFRLVREALAEREVMLHKAPHLIEPIRLMLPHRPHLRPAWMIRSGLFLYDHLSKRSTLPRSRSVDLDAMQENPLTSEMQKAFEYSDCWADDARLVIANILDAQERGAEILNRTRCIKACPIPEGWQVEFENTLTQERWTAKYRCLVNASGPWAQRFLEGPVEMKSPRNVRLIKGSHIVVPKHYEGSQCYLLQNKDKRVVFVIPYHNEFTLIGTTDKRYEGNPADVAIDNEEIDYLVDVFNKHFEKKIQRDDIVNDWSGVRPLCDDESEDPSAMTRDYTLQLSRCEHNAPLLNIFGGKLTTYRKLSEAALVELGNVFEGLGDAWTSESVLPGGAIEASLKGFIASKIQQYPFLSEKTVTRLCKQYGDRIDRVLNNAERLKELGKDYGHGLFEAEVKYLREHEWACTAEDILWRRSKLGLWFSEEQVQGLEKALEKTLDSSVVKPEIKAVAEG